MKGVSRWRGGKESAGGSKDLGSIPDLRRSLEVGNGNLLQYSCLENSVDRGAGWVTVHAAAESDVAERLSTHTEHMKRLTLYH